MRSGWIKVPRDLLDPSNEAHPHARGEPACRAFALLDLIGMANWRDRHGLKRGQVKRSQKFLASRWNWGKDKIGRVLQEWEAQGWIRRQKGHGREPDIITICNYDSYQGQRRTNHPTNDPTNGTSDNSSSATSSGAPLEEGEDEADEERNSTTSSFHSEVGQGPDEVNQKQSSSPDSDVGGPIDAAIDRILDPNGKITRGTLIGWARDLLGSPDDARNASVIDQMLDKGIAPGTVARAIVGLAKVRDEGRLSDLVPPGEACSLRILRTDYRRRSVSDIALEAFNALGESHDEKSGSIESLRDIMKNLNLPDPTSSDRDEDE